MALGWKVSWCWALPARQLPPPCATGPPSPILPRPAVPAGFDTCPFWAEEPTNLRKSMLFIFWLCLTWGVCPLAPHPGALAHLPWASSWAAVLAEVAEKHEVAGPKSVQVTPAATRMHTHWVSAEEGGNLPWGKEKRILHSALQRAVLCCKNGRWACRFCFHTSFSSLCAWAAFEVPDHHHPETTIYSWLKNNGNNVTISQEDSWQLY